MKMAGVRGPWRRLVKSPLFPTTSSTPAHLLSPPEHTHTHTYTACIRVVSLGVSPRCIEVMAGVRGPWLRLVKCPLVPTTSSTPAHLLSPPAHTRSEERRVGKEGVSRCVAPLYNEDGWCSRAVAPTGKESAFSDHQLDPRPLALSPRAHTHTHLHSVYPSGVAWCVAPLH